MSLSPARVGILPAEAPAARRCRQGVKQNTPLLVWITVANLTNFDSHIEISGPRDRTSPLVVANGTASFKAFLPTGDYLVSAADIPGAVAARLNVGPDRTSSANDLLLPEALRRRRHRSAGAVRGEASSTSDSIRSSAALTASAISSRPSRADAIPLSALVRLSLMLCACFSAESASAAASRTAGASISSSPSRCSTSRQRA